MSAADCSRVMDFINEHQDDPIPQLIRDLLSVFSLTPREAGQYMAEWVKQ